jgi:hypothetical protein
MVCSAGERYGKLVVEGDAGFTGVLPSGGRKRLVLCLCDCGKHAVVRVNGLRSKHVTSCGCVGEENKRTFVSRVSRFRFRHGMSRPGNKHPSYTRWSDMNQRCHDPNHHAYRRYGGRGIVVCERWRHDFAAYAHDIGDVPFKGATLDRIDNNGPYSPENVRWATRVQQVNNSGVVRSVTINGETHGIAEWCRILGVPHRRVATRIYHYGWDPVAALTEPKMSFADAGRSHLTSTHRKAKAVKP